MPGRKHDCVVTSVSCDKVTYVFNDKTVTTSLSQFTELANQTLAKGGTFIPVTQQSRHPVCNLLFGSNPPS